MNFKYVLYLAVFSVVIIFVCYRRIHCGTVNQSEKTDTWVCAGLGILCFALLFRSCILDNMKLSYTNINYVMPPFSSTGVKTAGPLLSDVSDAYLPSLWKAVVKHDLSLWDADIAFGVPSASVERLMYPLNWLYLLGMEYGQLLKTVAEYSIAFFGMFLFLRKRKLRIVSSFIGGISYCFSSVMVMWNGWEHSDVCAFGPWLFYFADCLIEHYIEQHQFRLRYCILFLACLYLMLVAGMPTYVPFFLYTGFVYLLYRLAQSFHQKEERKGGAYLLIALILCIVISGLMSFAYTGNLFFGTQDYQESRASQSFATLSIEYLRTLFFPYDRTSLGMHINESTLYIGPMILFWLPGIVASESGERKKRGEYRFWLIVAITSIVLIFVYNSGYFYRYLPGLNSSLKIRAIALFCFSASIVSAYSVDFCSSINEIWTKIRAGCLCLVLPVVLLLVFGKLEVNLKYYLVFFAVGLSLAFFTVYQKRYIGYAVCLILTCNMAAFAHNYLPMIEKDVPVIPKATDSLQYLKDNLQEIERFISLGAWNFFPQSNVFYGLNQVASHSFVNTEKDMRAYLNGISANSHRTATKTEFNEIDNSNLLSYASVKYMLSGNVQEKNSFQMIENMISEANGRRRAWAYRGDLVLEQHLVASDSEMNGVDLLLSTYTHDLSKNDVLELTLIRTNNGEIASTASIRLDTVLDNKIYSVKWNEPVSCAEGEEFILRLSSAHEFVLPLALWVTDQSIYDGELIINDQPSTGDISLIPTYSDGRMTFSDGETVEELSEYAPRAYFADSILRFASLDAVLEEMKSCFYPETALLDEATWSELSLQLNEDTYAPAAVENYSIGNDKIRMDVTTGTGGILIVTDYYDPDWKVYVNGQESQVFRTNYLFMGVELPASGDYHVEFKYRPTRLYKCIAISIFGFVLFVAVIVFRKRIEKAINKSSER